MTTEQSIELLNNAIAASGLSARAFAVGVLAVDERTVRRWIAGEREIPGTILVICKTIVDDPQLTHVYLSAAARIFAESGVWPKRNVRGRQIKKD